MASENGRFGLSWSRQLLFIGVLGAVVMAYGLASSSVPEAGYDPLAFGVGLVMVGYALVVFVWDRVQSIRN